MKYPAFDGTQNCAEVGPEFFYPETRNPHQHVVASIKRMCYGCWFQSECLEWGLRHEADGYWGGLSPTHRANLRRELGIILQTPQVTPFVKAAS